jgi:hypothetical protein
VRDEIDKLALSINIAIAHLHLGYLKSAIEITDHVDKRNQKAEVLCRIAESQASSGQIEDAVHLAQAQELPLFKTKVYIGAARGLVEATRSREKVTKESLLASY